MAFLFLSSSEQEEADARSLIRILRDATPVAAPTSGGFIFFPPFPVSIRAHRCNLLFLEGAGDFFLQFPRVIFKAASLPAAQ